jgi:hypothetical protein
VKVFGDFEFDEGSTQLRRGGTTVSVNGQCLDLLALMLDRTLLYQRSRVRTLAITLMAGASSRRTGYSISHLFVTRTDGNGRSPNICEIVGNGAAAGIVLPQPGAHLD